MKPKTHRAHQDQSFQFKNELLRVLSQRVNNWKSFEITLHKSTEGGTECKLYSHRLLRTNNTQNVPDIPL